VNFARAVSAVSANTHCAWLLVLHAAVAPNALAISLVLSWLGAIWAVPGDDDNPCCQECDVEPHNERMVRRGVDRGRLKLTYVMIGGGFNGVNPYTLMNFIRHVPDGAVLTPETSMPHVPPITDGDSDGPAWAPWHRSQHLDLGPKEHDKHGEPGRAVGTNFPRIRP